MRMDPAVPSYEVICLFNDWARCLTGFRIGFVMFKGESELETIDFFP